MIDLINIPDDDIEKMDKLYLALKEKYLLRVDAYWKMGELYKEFFKPNNLNEAYRLSILIANSGLVNVKKSATTGELLYLYLQYANNDDNFKSFKKVKSIQKRKSRREVESDFRYYLKITTNIIIPIGLVVSIFFNLYQIAIQRKLEPRILQIEKTIKRQQQKLKYLESKNKTTIEKGK